jgi:hypothetical protein
MHVVLLILSAIFGLACLISWFIILIDAFRYETWAGLLSIVFPPYLIYYAIFEFEHDYKWPITLGYLAAGSIAGALFLLAMGRPV